MQLVTYLALPRGHPCSLTFSLNSKPERDLTRNHVNHSNINISQNIYIQGLSIVTWPTWTGRKVFSKDIGV